MILKQFYHVYINNTPIIQIFTSQLQYNHLLINVYRSGSEIKIKMEDTTMIRLFNKYKDSGMFEIL